MPGQKGTKALQQKYGDALVCVRYRYDEKNHKQYKTVELIVSEKEWSPPPPRFLESAIVPLKIGAAEKTLQMQAKTLGGAVESGAKSLVYSLWMRCGDETGKADRRKHKRNAENEVKFIDI